MFLSNFRWKAWNYIAFKLILLKKIRKREKAR